MLRNKITASSLLGMARRYLGDFLIGFLDPSGQFFQILLNSCRGFFVHFLGLREFLGAISNNLE